MTDHPSDNVTKFPTYGIIEQLEELMELAKAGTIVGLCGYVVLPDGRVTSVITNHSAIDNGLIAYCSVLMSRLVGDDSDED